MSSTNPAHNLNSLRGVRSLIPPLCDSVNREIDDGIETAFKNWPRVLGFEIPGKAAAESDARNQAAEYERRMTALKSAVALPAGDAARAALKTALQDVLQHPRLTIRVAVLGAIFDRDLLTSAQKDMLQKAIDAVNALPDASARKIRAEQIWNAAPKRDVLQTAAEAFATASAAPRIPAIGFDQPLRASPFQVFADVMYNGKITRIPAPFDPSHPEALSNLVGVSFASDLSTQPLVAPPAGAGGPLPRILPGGVVNGAGYGAILSPAPG